MKKLNKIRLVMTGLLCGGLLTIGIGVGVSFGELSQFTYAGSKLLSDSSVKSFTTHVELFNPDAQLYINTYSFNGPFNVEDCLVTSEDVAPGTVQIEADYRSVASVPEISHHQFGYLDEDNAETLYLNWNGSPAALFFAYKDEILSDIQNRRLGDYRECQLSNLLISVNPADKDRINFN